MSQKKRPSSDLKLFQEMCDLMFEIAKEDDDWQRNKSKYLNKHIAEWISPRQKVVSTPNFTRLSRNSRKINSTSRQRTPPPSKPVTVDFALNPIPSTSAPSVSSAKDKFCYRCALPLHPGQYERHFELCEGIHATCRFCNTKGHVKAACGKLGHLPSKNYNSTSRKTRWSPVE